jgi:hypothetical protein
MGRGCNTLALDWNRASFCYVSVMLSIYYVLWSSTEFLYAHTWRLSSQVIKMTFSAIFFLMRKPSLSLEEFKNVYENKHLPLL